MINYEDFKKEVKDHILEYLPETFADWVTADATWLI